MLRAKNYRSLTCFSKKEVRDFFSNATIVHHTPYCIIRKQPTDQDSKIIISIPKSVGCAPYRNLYKRRLKHIFYEEKLFKSGARWGIFIKKNAQLPSYEALKALLIECIKKV